MKQFSSCLTRLASVLLCCFPVIGIEPLSAADDYHFLYLSGSGGYSSLYGTPNNVSALGAGAGMGGLGYQLRLKGGFWLSLGADISLVNARYKVSPFTLSATAMDTQGKSITMHYAVSQTDSYRRVAVGVPVMAGYFYQGFYCGAGFKISLPLSMDVTTGLDYTTSATYSQYIEDFADMSDHDYGRFADSQDQQASSRLNGSLLLEAGYDVLRYTPQRRTNHILNIGLYAEMGLTSVTAKPEQGQRVLFVSDNATVLRGVPYFAWTGSGSNACLPFYIGVRLTYMLGGGKSKGSYGVSQGCQCYGN